MSGWIDIGPGEVGGIVVSLLVLYSAVIALTRIFGLRSFSKMSAADFAMTVAVGTILGGAIANRNPAIPAAALALTGLFAAQWLVARLRHGSAGVRNLLDNRPVFLMREGQLLHDNLERTGVSVADVRAKLREANALRLENVAAVVFETTGDVSVLHGDQSSELDPFIVEDVEGGGSQ